MTVATPIAANALALALKEWNNGIHDYASLIAAVSLDIATLEHKPRSDPSVMGRARVAAATVITAKSGSDFPGGGIVNAIGGTVAGADDTPIGAGIVGIVKAPITVAAFLARLTDVRIWIRVAEVGGGAVLLIIGVRMLAREAGVPLPSLPGLRG